MRRQRRQDLTLAEKRREFRRKQDLLGDVFTVAKDGDTYDLARPAVLSLLGVATADAALDAVRRHNAELDILHKDLRAGELKDLVTGRPLPATPRDSGDWLRSWPPAPAFTPHRAFITPADLERPRMSWVERTAYWTVGATLWGFVTVGIVNAILR